MTEIHTGSCNCGAVRFRTTGKLREVVYCHCSQCRKQTGYFYAATNGADAELEVEGGDSVTWYQSSDFAKRGFCRACGSALFWNPDIEGYQYISIAMGLFDGPTGVRLAKHTFVAEKGDYYDICDGLPQHERF